MRTSPSSWLRIVLAVSGPVPTLSTAKRRDAHHLAGLDARIRLDAPAVDADLAGAQQFLEMAKAEARIVDLEPAVEAHARLAVIDLDLLYACHFSFARLSRRNSISRAFLRATIPGRWRKQRAQNTGNGITQRRNRRAALPKHREIEREGGKRREAAEDAGGDEKPDLVRRVEPSRQQLDEDAHHEGTGDVDRHRAPEDSPARQASANPD